LGEADRHVATAEKSVSEQRMQVEKLRRDGQDVELAQRTLGLRGIARDAARASLIIVRTIVQIDHGLV
jgi:hypothetical protein